MVARSRPPLVPSPDNFAPVSRSASVWALLRLIFLVPVMFVLLAGSLIVVYQQQHANRIYPGVSVLGLSLGGATRAEAYDMLRKYVRGIQQRPLVVRFHETEVRTNLGTLGLRISDPEIARLIELAWWVGRGLPLAQWVPWHWALLTQGYEVPASLTLDTRQAADTLARLAAQLDQRPANASLQVARVGDRFEVHLIPGRAGRRLDIPATLERLQRSLAGYFPTTLNLVVEETPPTVNAAHVAAPRAAVEQLLAAPLELRADDQSWSLAPATLFELLDRDALAPGDAPPVVRLQEAQVREQVAEIAAEANQPARNASLHVRGGEVVIVPGQSGRVVDEVSTVHLIMQHALTAQRVIALPFVRDEPWLKEHDLLGAQGLAEHLLSLPLLLRYEDHEWVLERPALLSMVTFPDTQAVPRNVAELPLAERPRFEIGLDPEQVQRFIAAEVAPLVSRSAEDARIALRDGQVEVIAGRIGVVPDEERTYAAMVQAVRRVRPEGRVAIVHVRQETPRQTEARLEPVRRAAERLVTQPVELYYRGSGWTISAADLAGMLRFRDTDEGPEAYLAREPLLAQVEKIAADAAQRRIGPRTRDGEVRPVDVVATAAAVWQAAQSVQRLAEVQFLPGEAQPLPTPTPPPGRSPPWIPRQ